MSILITAEPARPELFTPGGREDAELLEPRLQPLADSLHTAYRERAGHYYSALTGELGKQGGHEAVSFIPSAVLPDGEEIMIDHNLFQTLLELYLCDGWGPLDDIEAELRAAARPEGRPDAPSAGVPALPWLAAYDFFVFTRNVVALLVRESLTRIEQRAATVLLARQTHAAEQLKHAIDGVFQITTSKSQTAGAARGPRAPVHIPITLYHFANRPLMDELTRVMNDAAKQRVALEQLIRDIAATERQRRDTQTAMYGAQGGSGGPAASDAAAKDKALAKQAQEQQTLRQAVEGMLAQLKAVIAHRAPLALLVVDAMKPGFGREALEMALGRALFGLRDQLATLGQGIDPQRSFTAEVLAGVAVSDTAQVALADVQAVKVPPGGPEAVVARRALDRLSADPHLFSVVHEQTWWLLVQSGEVARDSFDYVVLHHYLAELERQAAALEAGAATTEAFFTALAKLSAVIGIALLVTPLAEVAPALIGLSRLVDAAVIAYQVYSVVGQLAALDKALSTALLSADPWGLAQLAELGDLLLARGDLAAGLTEAVLIELLVAMAFKTGWRPVRRAIIMRGFYNDVQTLVGADA